MAKQNFKARRKGSTTHDKGSEERQLDFVTGSDSEPTGFEHLNKEERSLEGWRTSEYEKALIEAARKQKEEEMGIKLSKQNFLTMLVIPQVKQSLGIK